MLKCSVIKTELNKKEIKRQLAHLSGIGTIFFIYLMGKEITGLIALFISLYVFLLSIYVKTKNDLRKKMPVRVKEIEKIEDSFHELVDSAERENTKLRYMGAVLFFLSIGLCLLIFPEKIAVISIIVLSVGDSFSTLIGVHFGKNKTRLNPKKSYEGTLGGFFSCFIICLFFTNPLISVIASGVGMLMELWPVKINDNILMPFSVGFVLILLSSIGILI